MPGLVTQARAFPRGLTVGALVLGAALLVVAGATQTWEEVELYLVGGAMVLFGGGVLAAEWRREDLDAWLRAHGRRVVGDAWRLERNERIAVNERHPWRVVVQWRDPATGQRHEATSRNLWVDACPRIERTRRLTVLVDPARPRRHLVDLSFLDTDPTPVRDPFVPGVRRGARPAAAGSLQDLRARAEEALRAWGGPGRQDRPHFDGAAVQVMKEEEHVGEDRGLLGTGPRDFSRTFFVRDPGGDYFMFLWRPDQPPFVRRMAPSVARVKFGDAYLAPGASPPPR